MSASNLRDHFSAAIEYERKQPGPFASNMRLDRISIALAKAYFLGAGFATDLPSGWTGFIKSDSGKDAAGYPIPVPGSAGGGGALSAAVQSRLHRRLRLPRRPGAAGKRGLCASGLAGSACAPCAFSQRPLAADTDVRALRQGLRVVYEMGTRKSVASFIGQVLSPLGGQTSDQDLDAFIRGTAQTAHHPLGTCKMGSEQDADAVVDGELRVRGMDGLRVVDASVIPDAIGGNINAAVIMIAERASDLIRGRTPLPPAGPA